jgi:molybdopterin-guanine dinucleotide biosynthesis protein A
MKPAIHGIILAGGRSTRMGTDKALLPVHGGKPLLQHICDTLACVCAGVTVVVPGDEPHRYDGVLDASVRTVPDLFPGHGPLAGIHAGLLALPEPDGYGFLMACDMPRFSPRLFAEMVTLLKRGRSPDAVLCPDQPFHALYHKRVALIAEQCLQRGALKLTSFLNLLDTAYAALPGDDCFLNLNTPHDYEAFMQENN